MALSNFEGTQETVHRAASAAVAGGEQPLATLGSAAETRPAHMPASLGHAEESLRASSDAAAVDAIQQPPTGALLVQAYDLEADPSREEEQVENKERADLSHGR